MRRVPGGALGGLRHLSFTFWWFAPPKEKQKAGDLLARRPLLEAP